jgi:uncharacterized UPF0160 family protein
MEIKKICTHSGTFHADEVTAIAILKLIYPEAEILRSRNSEDLDSSDMRVDVGMKYDPETNDFDHHQKEGAGKRKNLISYASAGLIWKHFGEKLTSNSEIHEKIDKKIIQTIDAIDVGYKPYTFKETEPYTISHIIQSFNPLRSKATKKDYDSGFFKAVDLVTNILQNEINILEEANRCKEIILRKIEETDKEYLVLEEPLIWKNTVITESSMKFVIANDKDEDKWIAVTVPVEPGSFEARLDFPQEWGGLEEKELQEVSKVPDAIFCHNDLFIAVAKSKEGAISLVEKALEKSI